MAYAKEHEVREGTLLLTDGSFTCMNNGVTRKVHEDQQGLYLLCRDGHHYIDGQLEGDEYFGLTLA